MRDKVSDAHAAVNRIRDVREQVVAWKKRAAAHPAVVQAADEVLSGLAAIEDKMILPGEQKDNYGLIAHARLNAAVCEVYSMAISADAKPTKAVQSMFAQYAAAIEAEVGRLNALLRTDLAEMNAAIAAAKLPAVL